MNENTDNGGAGMPMEEDDDPIETGLYAKMQDYLIAESRKHVEVYNGVDYEDFEEEHISSEQDLQEDLVDSENHHMQWDSVLVHQEQVDINGETKPSKKFYFRRKSFVPVYRIVKSDIRRQYCTMFCNVINSHQASLLYSFLNTYTVPSLICKSHMDPKTKIVPKFAGIRGQFQTTSHLASVILFFALGQLAPDLFARCENVVIRTWTQSERCELECDFPISGTVLVDFHVKQIAAVASDKASCLTSEQPLHSLSLSPSSPPHSINQGQQVQKIVEDLDGSGDYLGMDLLQNKTLFNSPIAVTAYTRLTIKVNENRMIEGMFIT